MFKRIHVIINPASGKDKPILSTLNTVFQEQGVDWDAFLTKDAGDARRLACAAVEAKVDAVAVYGGDGTIAEVAGGLADSGMPLAILPGGTANAIALALNIPVDLTAAAQLACDPADSSAVIKPTDLGQIDDKFFVIAVGVGIPGALAEGADREQKDRLGWLAYAVSTVQALRDTPISHYHMVLDGKEVESEGVMCVIANSGSFGIPGVALAPNIDMSDGVFDIFVINNASAGNIVSMAASVVTKNEGTAPYEHWQAREVSVVSDPSQPMQADGEVLEEGPVCASLLPQAVRFVVPAAQG